MSSPLFLPGIAELALRFDGFILDLWGVLHDGTHPYPHAIETLERLRGAEKKIILLSNAPRQATKVRTVLDTIGFPRDHYDHILTSGEAARTWLTEKQPYGDTYYYIGPPKDQDLLAGTPYKEVCDPKDAAFTLLTGFDAFGDGMETKLPQVEASLKAGLPLVCTNPDRKVVKQDGSVMLCAGLLAEWYAAHGGHVDWFGKPYAAVYERCIELFSRVSAKSEQGGEPSLVVRNTSGSSSWQAGQEGRNLNIVAIGDSLHTDIAGAKAAGIYSVLCAGGILAEGLGVHPGEMPSPEALAKLSAEEGVSPDALIPSFRW